MGKTILLVEDDLTVRNAMRQMLHECADMILDASSSEDALQVSEEQAGSIDLLIVDVILPKMNGKELAIRLKSAHPKMQILYMSAYPDGIVEQHGLTEERFIRKPFDVDDLIGKVKGLLNSGV